MLKSVIDVVKDLRENRKLIWKLSKNDFKTRYAGSYLGIVWAIIQPVIIVLMYWFVFEVGLNSATVQVREGIDVPFVLWLTSGLVPWLFFSEALSNGTNALLEYNYLVKKVVFNINILPIVKVVSSVFIHVFFVAFMLVLFIGYGQWPGFYVLQLLYYSLCLFVLCMGISFITSAVVIFFRDLSQIINIFLQVGIWMTPIMWTIDKLDRWPVLKMIFKLNPLYYIVYGYRDALFYKVPFWERAALTGYFWTVVVVLWIAGTHVFRKLKVHFADIL